MPQIPTYSVPEQESNLRIPEGGAQFLSQGARRLGVTGNEAAQSLEQGTRQLAGGVESIGKVLNEHQYNADVSTMHKDIFDNYALAQNQIGDIEANNPDNVQAALNQINQQLDAAKEQYASKYTSAASQKKFGELWDQHADDIRKQLITTSASASGDAAAKNLTGSLNTAIGLARTTADPERFDSLLARGNRMVDDSAQMVPSAKRQQYITDFKTKYADQLAVSTLEGVIAKDPAQAKALLDSGKLDQYLVGQEKNTLYNHVETATRFHANDAERTARNQAADMKRASQEQSNTYLTGFTTDPTSGAVRAPSDFNKNVLADPTLDASDKRTLIEFGQRMDANAGKEVKTTPGLLNEFTQRLALPQGDPNRPSNPEILGHIGKDLSLTDGRFLLQQNQVHTPNDKLGQNQVATGYRMLDSFFNNPSRDTSAEQINAAKLNVDRAHAWFNTAIQGGLERGLTLLQLTSPGDPNYVLGKVDPATGIPENLAQIPGIVGNPFAAPAGEEEKPGYLQRFWKYLNTPSNEAVIPGKQSSNEPHEGASSNVAYNNFANMRSPGSMSLWQSFANPSAGIQAIENQLQRYASRGIETVSQIISTWAPPNENPTERLIAQAARRLGVSPGTTIDMSDPQARTRMVAALIMQEHGYIPPTAAAVLGERLNG